MKNKAKIKKKKTLDYSSGMNKLKKYIYILSIHIYIFNSKISLLAFFIYISRSMVIMLKKLSKKKHKNDFLRRHNACILSDFNCISFSLQQIAE